MDFTNNYSNNKGEDNSGTIADKMKRVITDNEMNDLLKEYRIPENRVFDLNNNDNNSFDYNMIKQDILNKSVFFNSDSNNYLNNTNTTNNIRNTNDMITNINNTSYSSYSNKGSMIKYIFNNYKDLTDTEIKTIKGKTILTALNTTVAGLIISGCLFHPLVLNSPIQNIPLKSKLGFFLKNTLAITFSCTFFTWSTLINKINIKKEKSKLQEEINSLRFKSSAKRYSNDNNNDSSDLNNSLHQIKWVDCNEMIGEESAIKKTFGSNKNTDFKSKLNSLTDPHDIFELSYNEYKKMLSVYDILFKVGLGYILFKLYFFKNTIPMITKQTSLIFALTFIICSTADSVTDTEKI